MSLSPLSTILASPKRAYGFARKAARAFLGLLRSKLPNHGAPVGLHDPKLHRFDGMALNFLALRFQRSQRCTPSIPLVFSPQTRSSNSCRETFEPWVLPLLAFLFDPVFLAYFLIFVYLFSLAPRGIEPLSSPCPPREDPPMAEEGDVLAARRTGLLLAHFFATHLMLSVPNQVSHRWAS